MKYAAMCIWLVLPMTGYAAYTLYGLPHVIVAYSFHDNGDPHNPLKIRQYTRCQFFGWYGSFSVPAERGECAWIRFFKAVSSQ